MATRTSRALARFNAKAAALSPKLRRAWLDGFRRLAKMLPPAKLEQLLLSGGLERLLSGAITPQAVNAAFVDFRAKLRAGSVDAALYFSKDLPKAAQTAVGFNYLSPRVTQALGALDSRVMEKLTGSVRETVRAAVGIGLERGWNPRTTARYLTDNLPLAPNQLRAIDNFQRMLETGDRDALTRALRDRRFDATLRKGLGAGGTGLSREQIDKMVGTYRERMKAFNAETISRTASLDALKDGQWNVWQEAIDDGTLPADEVWKEWIAVNGPVGDGRNRQEHLAMHGETRLASEPYSNGEMVPGSSTYNCRCISRFFMSGQDEHTEGVGESPERAAAKRRAGTAPTTEADTRAMFDQMLFGEAKGTPLALLEDVPVTPPGAAGKRVAKPPAAVRRSPTANIPPDQLTTAQAQAELRDRFNWQVDDTKVASAETKRDTYRTLVDGARQMEAAGFNVRNAPPMTLSSHLRTEGTFGWEGKPHIWYKAQRAAAHEANMAEQIMTGYWSTAESAQTVTHEFAHWLHWLEVGDARFTPLSSVAGKGWSALAKAPAKGVPYSPAIQRFKAIAKRVSGYAATDPMEFVAECFDGLLVGETYDVEVRRLYKKLGGPIAPMWQHLFKGL